MSIISEISDLLLSSPLYQARTVVIENDHDKLMMRMLRYGKISFDAHCVFCNKDSHFKDSRSHTSGMSDEYIFSDGEFSAAAACARHKDHTYRYYFNLKKGVLQKIGQFPSLEDVTGADILKYRKILGPFFTELKKATGLASHGIGIGAFVYLRRVFERLILSARERQKGMDNAPTDESFGKLRMDEKIGSLTGFLPSLLVKNKSVYGILSKGIHELDEQSCKLHFPVVRSAILQILEQDFQAREQERLAEETEKQIAKITASLKNGDTGVS